VINFRFLLMSTSIATYPSKPSRSTLLGSVQIISASTFATSLIKPWKGRMTYPLHYFLGVCAASFPTAILATALG
jgi:predicted branched-subunit amino acid permease